MQQLQLVCYSLSYQEYVVVIAHILQLYVATRSMYQLYSSSYTTVIATMYVLCTMQYCSYTQLVYYSLSYQEYHKIIYKAQLTFFHSIHNKYAPTTFSPIWQFNSETNPAYQLRNAANYFVPPANFAFFERSPLHVLPKVWNNAGTITL